MADSDATRRWRLIVDGPSGAAMNMAHDEAIMRAAARGGPVTLRFYRWEPHAFSIGYFQHYEEFAGHAATGIPVVRRLTGGGAIYHADEITYSLAGPFGHPFPQRAAVILEVVHDAIAKGLRGLGVAAELCDAPAGRSPVICFQRAQKCDIVVGGRKLLGSAQRRYKGFFLQHGSLPLSPNRFAPEAASLGQVVEKRLPEATIVDALAGALGEAFGAGLVSGALSDEETADAERLAVDKYAADAWNRRR